MPTKKIIYTFLLLIFSVISFPFQYSQDTRLFYNILVISTFIFLITLLTRIIFPPKAFKSLRFYYIPFFLYVCVTSFVVFKNYGEWVDRIDFGSSNDLALQVFELGFFRQVYFASVFPIVLFVLLFIWMRFIEEEKPRTISN